MNPENVFTMAMDATDHQATFSYNFTFGQLLPINRTATTSTSFTLTAGENSDKFKLTIHPYNGSAACAVCATIQLLDGNKRRSIELFTDFRIRTLSRPNTSIKVSSKSMGRALLLGGGIEAIVVDVNEVSKILAKAINKHDYFFTLDGFYVSHTSYSQVTSSPSNMSHIHTSVNLSYTWTVCKLTLPLLAKIDRFTSNNFPVSAVGLVEFRLKFRGVSLDYNHYIQVFVAAVSIPEGPIGLRPFTVTQKLSLLRGAPKQQTVHKEMLEEIRPNMSIGQWRSVGYFRDSDIGSAMWHQCASFKFYIVYNTTWN
jgi:hypothetical protein